MLSKRALLPVLLSLAVFAAPTTASATEPTFPEYSGDDFKELVSLAFSSLPGLDEPGEPGLITGSSSVDDRIWDRAFVRGYQMTPLAEVDALRWSDGHLMQPVTADAWQDLREAAASAGHPIEVTSAYRSIADQKLVFMSRFSGTSDAAIDAGLAHSAPPGASRHHTGYAIDIKESGSTHGGFGSSKAFAWLAADNYHNAKTFGFIPSYPPDATNQGPDPEPWEYVYVGFEVLYHDSPFYDVLHAHLFAAEIEWLADEGITKGCSPDGNYFCPSVVVDRGSFAAFLVRALGLDQTQRDYFQDDDTSIFESNINTLASHGITRGCDPPENNKYCPDRPLDRGALAALLRRSFELPATQTDYFDDDAGSVFESDINALAEAGITKGCGNGYCPERLVTRGELAAMLYRARAFLP